MCHLHKTLHVCRDDAAVSYLIIWQMLPNLIHSLSLTMKFKHFPSFHEQCSSVPKYISF